MCNDRRKEIVSTCLDVFMENGISQTSMRDLGRALKMDPTALYKYYDTRDDILIACAEKATVRIESELFETALEVIDNPEQLVKDLDSKAVSMRPLMQFFISVCVSRRYSDKLKDVRFRQGDRYRFYIGKMADKLGCSYDDIAPLVYIVSNTMFSYMIFDPDNFSAPQLRMVYNALLGFLDKKSEKDAV